MLDSQRLDVNNDLLLCPNHGYLFDKSLITFDDIGGIKVPHELSESQKPDFNIQSPLRIQMNSEKQNIYITNVHLLLNLNLKGVDLNLVYAFLTYSIFYLII